MIFITPICALQAPPLERTFGIAVEISPGRGMGEDGAPAKEKQRERGGGIGRRGEGKGRKERKGRRYRWNGEAISRL